MKTEKKTAELVAIEETSLETVAGGYSLPSLNLNVIDVKVEKIKQSNELIFAGNAIAANGAFTFVAEQTNVNQ